MIERTFKVPEDMNGYIAHQEQHYGGFGKYMRQLIQRDQEAKNTLRAELQKGLDSGVSERSLDDIWNDCKTKYEESCQ